MAVSPPSFPGWYRDPGDPVQLQHWNGRGWDPRRRTVPAWAMGTRDVVITETSRREGDPTLEGPVHPAGLPAIAAAAAQSSRPGGRAAGPRHLAGGRGTTRAGAAAPGWATGTRPVRRSAWSRPRLALMTVAGLIGLVVLVLAATFGIAPQPPETTSLAQDTAFTRSANIACGEAMGAIHLANSPAITAAGTSPAVATPSAVAAANRNLSRLATRIRALPVIDAARSSIQGWLDEWDQYAADRQLQATATARSAATPAGSSRTSGSLASTVSLDADQADAFATTNGLGDCALTTSSAPVTAP